MQRSRARLNRDGAITGAPVLFYSLQNADFFSRQSRRHSVVVHWEGSQPRPLLLCQCPFRLLFLEKSQYEIATVILIELERNVNW